MKFIATIISLSLTAGAAVLPAAASFDQSSSDRDAWIEQALSSNNGGSVTAKKVSTSKTSNAGGSLTASNGSNLARSVAGLFPGVRMRPFVPNRYLPSEHDVELASSAQQQSDAAAQLPPSTVQLAKAMAKTQTVNAVQHQLQGGTAYNTAYTYTGGYSNAPDRGQLLAARNSRMTSVQSRVNALAPAIPEPMSSNETIGQIRSALRSNQSGQLIADASTDSTTYGANLYPDIVGPVPTQATANARNSAPFPLSLLPQKTARSYAYTGSGAGNRTNASSSSSRSSNLPAATLGSWKTTQPAQQQYAAQQFTNIQSQQSQSKLSYGGFQSYTGKVHVQPPVVRQTQNARTGSGAGTYNTSSLPADCNIASADNYSTNTTRVASYAPYSGIQSSSSLPY